MNHFHRETVDEWEDIGPLAWVDVPAYGENPVYIQLNTDTNHPFMNIGLHMLSHIVKEEMINETKWNEFLKIHYNKSKYLLHETPFTHDANEYFSESFSYFFYNEKSKQQLKEQAPKTYKFIERMITPKNSENNEAPILFFKKYNRSFYLVVATIFIIFISGIIIVSKLTIKRNR